MKGQLTIEYLFLALVSFALIAISLAALLKIREAGERAFHLELFRSSVLDIHNAGEELCAMGSGNSMKIKIRENISISQNSDETVFSNQELNISISKKTTCSYGSASALANSEIGIRNEGGRIEFEAN